MNAAFVGQERFYNFLPLFCTPSRGRAGKEMPGWPAGGGNMPVSEPAEQRQGPARACIRRKSAIPGAGLAAASALPWL